MKKNKAFAGYHLLMILAVADGEFTQAEDKVIVDYLVHNFPLPKINFDSELHELANLSKEDYLLHFENMMEDFYSDSTEKERMELIAFAIKLSKATMPITAEENKYLNLLYNEWTETVE